MNHPQHAGENNGRPIRVLIADDSAVFRYTITKFIEYLPHLELVGVAGDGPRALELAIALRPDLVLMDLDMPGLSGLETAALIHKSIPAAHVLIVTCDDSPEARDACLAQGVDGFISKWRLSHELERGVAKVFPDCVHPGRDKERELCQAWTETALHGAYNC